MRKQILIMGLSAVLLAGCQNADSKSVTSEDKKETTAQTQKSTESPKAVVISVTAAPPAQGDTQVSESVNIQKTPASINSSGNSGTEESDDFWNESDEVLTDSSNTEEDSGWSEENSQNSQVISDGMEYSNDYEEASHSIEYVEGYVMDKQGSIIYVDTVNPGGRTYPGEGEDRAIAYDISNATEDVPRGVRRGLTVCMEYYTENGNNIVVSITSDGDEKEPEFLPENYELYEEEDPE